MVPATDESSSQCPLQSLRVAFEILKKVDEKEGVGVSELSREMNIPKSTVHDYLQSLSSVGFLQNDGGKYRLSLRFLEFGGRLRKRMKVFNLAKAHIRDLPDEIDDFSNATIGVEEGGHRILLYKVEGDQAPYDEVPIGHHTNMHWTALGKALLSALPQHRVETIINEHGLPKATRNTITERSSLFDELQEIEEQGYALEDEERIEGVRAVAVPVLDTEGYPVCALSLSGPKTHFDEKYISERVEILHNRRNIIEIEYQNSSSSHDNGTQHEQVHH